MNTKKIPIRPGESVGRYYRRIGKLSAASRLGVQRKVGREWQSIKLSYRTKTGDMIRIRGAEGRSSPAEGLKSLAKAIVLNQKGRP